MPRSRALRTVGAALVAASIPPMLRPRRASAGTTRSTTLRSVCVKKCSGAFPVSCLCKGPSFGCFEICGVKGSTCCCRKGPGGKNAGVVACPPGTRCGGPGESNCPASCEVACGSKCCDEETEYCASPAQSLCCKRGEGTCRVLAKPGSGPGRGPAKCCPKAKPKCCADDQRANCCDADDACCAGRCCPPAKKCDKGVCRCAKDTTTCGPDCCKKGETCCDNKECCKKGETCSDGKCCPKGQVNCGGKGTCCEALDCCNGTCCTSNEVCLTGTCCPLERGFGSGKNARCCPPKTVAVRLGAGRFGCCPPAIPNCCQDDEVLCLPGQVCVSGGCVRL